MGIESLKSKVQKRLQQEELKKDYQEVGTFIKKRRKDLNMTQDMISNGICSVSYLSKIENNQIAPNDFFIKEIMTKLEIEEDFVKKNLEDQFYLEQTIESVFYSDERHFEELYLELSDIEDNVTIDICKFGYQTLAKEKMSGESLMKLESLIMNMNDFELKSYLFFSAMYFISYDDYKTALEVLLMGISIKGGNEYINALIHEQTYYVKQRLLRKNSSLQHYDEAIRIYRKYFNNDRTMLLTLHMLHYLSFENPTLAHDQIDTVNTGLLSEKTKDFFYLIKGRISFLLNRYQESAGYLSYIKENSEYNIEKLLLLYEICLIEDDMDMQQEIENVIKVCKMSRKDLKSKVYYHYLNETKEDDKKVYIRDVAIPFSIKSSHFRMLQFYTNQIMDICIKNSRYKEATQYYKKCNREIKHVDRILYSV